MKTITFLVILATIIMIGTSFYGSISTGTSINNSVQPSIQATTNTTIKQGGTAVVLPGAYESFVDSFNPFSSSIYPGGIQSLIYEVMFQVNPLNGTVLPFLGTNYSWSNNYLTLTINVRHNVTFSNGLEFNASDIVYTFNLLKSYPALDDYNVWSYLSSVTEVNAYQVQFNYKSPNVPSFYYLNLVYILPEQIWKNVSNPVTYTNPNPIGTGPFVLESVTSSEIELSANPHYWMPDEPHLSHIVYYAYTSDDAADLALEDGQATWAGLFVPDLNNLYISKDPAHYGYYYSYSTPIALQTNDLRFPLNQTFFREAMGYAINRTKIYEQGEYGYETPALGLSIIDAQASLLNSTNLAKAQALSQYNVTLAKQILSGHGYTWNSKGQLLEPNGTLVPTMTIMTPSGWTDWDADISIVSQEEAAIGITLNVVTPVYSTLYSYYETGNYWIVEYSNPEAGPTPYYGFYGQYYDLGNVTPIGQTVSTDMERWNSSTDGFSGYLLQYPLTANKTKQNELINKMASIILDNDPIITLVNGAIWYEYNNQSIGGLPTANNNYWIGSPYEDPSMEVVALHMYDRSDKITKITPTPTEIPAYIYAIIAVVIVVAIVGGTFAYTSHSKKERKFKK